MTQFALPLAVGLAGLVLGEDELYPLLLIPGNQCFQEGG